MKFSDGTSLWEMEQELRTKFPSTPEIWINPHASMMQYFPRDHNKRYKTIINPENHKIERKMVNNSIEIPLHQTHSLNDSAACMRGLLLHEIGHAQRPNFNNMRAATSAATTCMAVYLSNDKQTLHNINVLELSIKFICYYAIYCLTEKVCNSIEERKADTFMCQHADLSTLKVMLHFFTECDNSTNIGYANSRLSKYMPQYIAAMRDFPYFATQISFYNNIPDHPSFRSRIAKIEREIARRLNS